ncbi:MAG: hypothetical protein C4554_02255 [Dethiobacter sp.]|jgi:hypothetical protein|nr:MAG: hypothetical protein C4554_02255 [Dethiobacter sp.]
MISSFAFCFSRVAAFHWFVISLLGIMVRLDQDGVTAFVRWLKPDPKCYTSILKFFQASSWNLPARLAALAASR